MQPSARIIQALIVLLCAAGVARADDVSGTYDAKGRTVHVLVGQNDLYVSYSDLFGRERTCTCLAHAQKASGAQWKFDENAGLAGTIELDGKHVRFELSGPPDCCGAGWPGLPMFDAAARTPSTSCKVKAARAHFHDDTGEKLPAYVQKGDAVDVVPAPSNLGPFVLARFMGPKKWTLGLLKKKELACTSALPE
jgi:hypothetical protein